jgi:hypothetical protein
VQVGLRGVHGNKLARDFGRRIALRFELPLQIPRRLARDRGIDGSSPWNFECRLRIGWMQLYFAEKEAALLGKVKRQLDTRRGWLCLDPNVFEPACVPKLSHVARYAVLLEHFPGPRLEIQQPLRACDPDRLDHFGAEDAAGAGKKRGQQERKAQPGANHT